ncbi:MAG TPA: homocysteine S-methyltransferase family protein, partial [Holophaga sp.]|nr:homocysteine S-methyltransferase family protein [Holophaga sp.]
MTTLTSHLKERVLLLDGGMGALMLARNPTVEDYGGPQYDGCIEMLNVHRPEWIQEAHAAYFDAGADAVETLTLGCNEIVLADFGLQDRVEELNSHAVQLAREVARGYAAPKYVIGSVGPGTRLFSLGQVGYAEMYRSYLAQMRGLLRGGADAILIETSQDLGQIKIAVRAARAAMAELKLDRPLWVQVTVETNGSLLLGTDMPAVVSTVEMLGVDVLGLNCGTGPDEMHAALSVLAETSPFDLSCLPNAGLPVNDNGKLVYPLGPEDFAEKVARAAKDFNLNIVGGCCGTTPAHIRALHGKLTSWNVTHRNATLDRSAASLYQAVSLRQEPRPLIVGERTNANGSKRFREMLAREDYDGLVGIAREQQREGAHMLDVCVACVGRDEVRDMEECLKRLVVQTTLPLMVDATEVPVIERALQTAPGKCIVNSINFEDGGARARQVLELCRTYGAAVVGLTIDEEGMARTRERKLAVAQRLFDLVVKEFGFNPSDLIVDPLTFTLATGEEGSRQAAVATLEAIRDIKARFHGTLTMLGVSNVSFGLKPAVRHVLNALMLYHAVQAGLDLAIFDAAKVIPVPRIPEAQRKAAEDLIFDRRVEGYDPLKALLEIFGAPGQGRSLEAEAELAPVERLRRDILDGEKQRVADDVDAALAEHDPLFLINDVLLGAMKEVGERFGAGEMQLPFVLESAEAMKAAIRHLEPRLPKDASTVKGRVILATVKGDVHDIGKNLVEILLSNNGYEVENLGIKQPVEAILDAHARRPADAVGMSGLLVKSTVIMRENLVQMAERGVNVPVLLGGAALTRDYVEHACQPLYPGPVLYAQDAFEGLHHLNAIVSGEPLARPAAAAPGMPGITVLRKAGGSVELRPDGSSSWVQRGLTAPEPPFWGLRELEHTAADLFPFLDHFVVIRNRWSFTQGRLSDEAFETVLLEKAEPLLARWKARLLEEPLLKPRASYGYFPAQASGDALKIYDPDRERLLATLVFPRQAAGRRLCIADFFAPEASGRFDVLPLQL